MANRIRTNRHKTERGQILRYLAELGLGQSATPRSLLDFMDDYGYSLTPDRLDFHLRYMAEKGFVRLESFPKEIGLPELIRTVSITAKGVDYIDRRRAGDEGIGL